MGKGWAREDSQPRAWDTRYLSSVRDWSKSHELNPPGHREAVTDRRTPRTSVPAPPGQEAAAPETTRVGTESKRMGDGGT